MERETLAKIAGVILLVLILANFVLFVFVRISAYLFWAIIVLVAVLAWFVVPKIRKSSS